jgi:4-hydroxybenzoate polyprenyltransferase
MIALVANRLRDYALLMRFNRPIGIFLLLWPALWALLIAGDGHPQPGIVLIFVVGVILMRSAGCVINDFADREIDRYVWRTRNRPLTTGRIRPWEAKLLFTVLSLAAFALVLLLNPLTVMLSFAGALLALAYPFMKRLTHLPQVVLGAAFGWSVPMAFAAVRNELPPLAWLLFTATVLWTTVYDTMYAMVDRDDDIVLGVKSTAILFGDADRQLIGVLQVMLLVCLVMVGHQAGLGWYYYGSLGVAASLALYQQGLIRYRERENCFRAFLNNNWFGAVIFVGMLLHYLLAAPTGS